MAVRKLCISGPSNAGKDEAARWFAANTDLRFGGSTSEFLHPYVVSFKYGIPLADLRAGLHQELMDVTFRYRHEEKDLWYRVGNLIRSVKPSVLTEQVLEKYDIICGCRDREEILDMKEWQLYDLHIWVDNPRVPPDPTLKFGPELADRRVLNDGTLADYYDRLRQLAVQVGLILPS